MKTILLSIMGIIFIFGSVWLLKGNPNSAPTESEKENVSIVDGRQIIEIKARGGYSPSLTYAKANTPTTIKMITNGTFDCSSSLVIPGIGYRTYLPQTGITEIEIPEQEPDTKLQGLCSMGMFSFQIKFE
ncbi:MAG: hypothetical protein UR30_C0006G0008 [Candidatus Peregrinibacteria bacterium GW2011_GWC2_33_13]|nr:MAG: hypothetical protein UR30_C0006G0008 [Candidatus Peregrinibacteria bacterium GW2011_GWC2_33_13]